MSDIPVKCTRCRHKCMESDWIAVPMTGHPVKMEGGYGEPLMRWCPKGGWRQERRHADAEGAES